MPHISSQNNLHYDSNGYDNQRNDAIIQHVWMNNLLNGFHEGGDTRVQHQKRDHHCVQVFKPAVPKRLLLIRFLPGKFRPDNRNDGTRGI